MSMVETSAISVQPAVPASVLLTSTSVRRARYDRATPGSPTRTVPRRRRPEGRRCGVQAAGRNATDLPGRPSADPTEDAFLVGMTLCLPVGRSQEGAPLLYDREHGNPALHDGPPAVWRPSRAASNSFSGQRPWPTDRTSTMRPDIAPGGRFPDYELPDHTKVPRRLSELQGDDPLILTLARGHPCPKEHQQHLEQRPSIPRSPWHTPRGPRSPPTSITRFKSSAPRSAPNGRSSPTRGASSRRTSTSRSTPTPTTTR